MIFIYLLSGRMAWPFNCNNLWLATFNLFICFIFLSFYLFIRWYTLAFQLQSFISSGNWVLLGQLLVDHPGVTIANQLLTDHSSSSQIRQITILAPIMHNLFKNALLREASVNENAWSTGIDGICSQLCPTGFVNFRGLLFAGRGSLFFHGAGRASLVSTPPRQKYTLWYWHYWSFRM